MAAVGLALFAGWFVLSPLLRKPEPGLADRMLTAAHAMQAASAVLRSEKEARGLMQPADIDVNQTGMIGAEYTSITSTLGELPAKRTATNPDLAAAITKLLGGLALPRGAPVVLIISGSFVGGDIAAIAAVEALELRPILVTSLGASMYGANDPGFNLLDTLGVLNARKVLHTRPVAALLGADNGVGGGMEPDGVRALTESARRENVPLVIARPFAALVEALLANVRAALRPGEEPGAIMNVGGAIIGLGSCRESHEQPPGFITTSMQCTGGTPGLALRLAQGRIPVLHVLNIRRLAVELGLPFDPAPLPAPGTNLQVYGARQQK